MTLPHDIEYSQICILGEFWGEFWKATQENLQAQIDLAEHITALAGNAGSTGNVQIKSVRENRKRAQRKSHVDYLKVGGADD